MRLFIIKRHFRFYRSKWLSQEAILAVYHIGQTQRTFHHERYINMRGKTIDVRPYDKRIPMSVGRLKHTIHQAVARKSE